MAELDSKRLMDDAEYAAKFFASEDVNSAHTKLSEGGATGVNLTQVVISLSKKVQELKGAGTPEGDKAQLENEDTPGSQKEALKLGQAANENAEKQQKEQEEKREREKEENSTSTSTSQNPPPPRDPGVITGDEKKPTPNQPSSSSGIKL